MDNKMTKKENDKLTLENRVLILEIFKKNIEDDVNEIKEEGKKFEEKLDKIVSSMNMIKNIMIGMSAMWMIQQVGIIEFAKAFLS